MKNENYDDFYSVRIVEIDDFLVNHDVDEDVILKTVIDDGPELLSYVANGDSEALHVVFHGAVRLKDRYPRFDRIKSHKARSLALLSFADPTLLLNPTLRLGWYLGSEEWDPLDAIKSTILSIMEKLDKRKLVLIGGSGGGFAAMRVGLEFPDSLVFVFSPQSSILNYSRSVVDEYLSAAYPNRSLGAVSEQEIDKFSVIRKYQVADGEGPVLYYLQNRKDIRHMKNHYGPMKTALGVETNSGLSAGGTIRFVTYSPDTFGHRPPSVSEYNLNLKKAFRFKARVDASRQEIQPD